MRYNKVKKHINTIGTQLFVYKDQNSIKQTRQGREVQTAIRKDFTFDLETIAQSYT